MCTTPLQMLIAEKIIALNPSKRFDLLILAHSDSPKYRYYFERLKLKCMDSFFFINDKAGLKPFIEFKKKINANNINKTYSYVYLASIDSRYLQYIVSQNKGAKIYTFDDGTANIVKQSPYYTTTAPKFMKRFIWRVLGVRYYINHIKNFSSGHYTLYRNVPNIIDNTIPIKLYENTYTKSNTENTKTLRFYLGQPLTEVSSHYSNKYIEDTIRVLDIDYYFPHPRENDLPDIQNLDFVESQLIFEDYIVKFLKNNPNTNLIVYSFTSSCILNISHIERVEAVYIYDSYLMEKFKNFYNLANLRFNIPCIGIE